MEEEEGEVELRGAELDLSDEDGEGDDGEGGERKRSGVKLSSLLPKGLGKASASSSKKGSSTPKPPVKRKRGEESMSDPMARLKKARKNQGSSDSEDQDIDLEQVGVLWCISFS